MTTGWTASPQPRLQPHWEACLVTLSSDTHGDPTSHLPQGPPRTKRLLANRPGCRPQTCRASLLPLPSPNTLSLNAGFIAVSNCPLLPWPAEPSGPSQEGGQGMDVATPHLIHFYVQEGPTPLLPLLKGPQNSPYALPPIHHPPKSIELCPQWLTAPCQRLWEAGGPDPVWGMTSRVIPEGGRPATWSRHLQIGLQASRAGNQGRQSRRGSPGGFEQHLLGLSPMPHGIRKSAALPA